MTRTFHLLAVATSATLVSLAFSPQLLAADQTPTAVDATTAQSADSSKSLTDQMSQLSGGSNTEKFYVVQDRQSGNAGVFDLAVGAGFNTNSDVNIQSTESQLRLKFHPTNRLFVSLAGSQVKNKLNRSAQRRIDDDGIYPDVGFVKSRADFSLGYNLIYGKARVSKDSVFYFDQYVALGGGTVEQTNTRDTARTPAIVGDVGASFWFGRRVSFAIGAKAYRFKEIRIASEGIANHVVGYANVGVLMGGAG
jgi:outer membrane beta-barrel protein